MSRLATFRLCRTADGRYCTEDDPAAAVLVCAVGQPLPDDYEEPDAGPASADEPELHEKIEPAAEPEKIVEPEPTAKRDAKKS